MDEDAHTFLLQAEPLISARTQMSCLIWNSGAIPIRQYATMTSGCLGILGTLGIIA